jgi:hypothetical protein
LRRQLALYARAIIPRNFYPTNSSAMLGVFSAPLSGFHPSKKKSNPGYAIGQNLKLKEKHENLPHMRRMSELMETTFASLADSFCSAHGKSWLARRRPLNAPSCLAAQGAGSANHFTLTTNAVHLCKHHLG